MRVAGIPEVIQDLRQESETGFSLPFEEHLPRERLPDGRAVLRSPAALYLRYS